MNTARAPYIRSLSTKLLLLTVLFVLLAEAVLLIPSIAKHRLDWFAERIEGAYLVGLALDGSADEMIAEDVAMQLFDTAGILGVKVEKDGVRRLILAPNINPHGPNFLHRVDLENQPAAEIVFYPWAALFSGGNQYIEVKGTPRHSQWGKAEIIVSQRELRRDLWSYTRRILGLSLVISSFTAGLVFWALNHIIVRPVKDLTANITAFEEDPDHAERILRPSNRQDEIGMAENSLAAMERRIHGLLNSRRRLATLGAGISKISHDLRNILASAQLMSDRLARSDDPQVKKLSPRLISALDRAIVLSRNTLAYGRMEPSVLERTDFKLTGLLEEVADANAAFGIEIAIDCPDELDINADRTHFYRTLSNLVANAIDAVLPQNPPSPIEGEPEPAFGKISMTAMAQGKTAVIHVADTGPGIPQAAQEALFEPFKGSQKPGGSGLGLAIASEIVKAHGGALRLKETNAEGTTFEITLPGAIPAVRPHSVSTAPVNQTPSRLGSAPPS